MSDERLGATCVGQLRFLPALRVADEELRDLGPDLASRADRIDGIDVGADGDSHAPQPMDWPGMSRIKPITPSSAAITNGN